MASQAAKVQMQIRENSNELNDFLKDLNRWEDSIRNEDNNLKSSRRINEILPPVRIGKPKKQSAGGNVKEEKKKKQRIKSSDYDGWAKFDVEAACKDSSQESSENDDDQDMDEEELTRIQENRNVQQAAMEKEKGNQLFKEGKYEAAINRYTSAITLHPTNPILYANRGMALLKTGKYGAAECDCNTALQYDPTYAKALARRATAREKLKKYQKALDDYQTLLQIEPQNKQASAEMEKIKKLLSRENDENSSSNVKSEIVKGDCVGRRRSTKPLKRIHIEEIGFEEEEEEELNKPEQSTGKTNRLMNDRVPVINNMEEIQKKGTVQATSTVPTTSFMFETELKRLKEEHGELYKYLKIIPVFTYEKLFLQCVDSLISPFITVLLHYYVRDGLQVHEELDALSKVKRFDMAVMFLSKSDKENLSKLLSHTTSESYSSFLSKDRAVLLFKKYGIR